MAYDSTNMANRAFVFMNKSIASTYRCKDFVYILSVKEITADVYKRQKERCRTAEEQVQDEHNPLD